jgi:conjugative transposon TraK protein
MFTKAKNIDTAFKYVRLFSIAFMMVCLAVTCFVIYSSNATIKQFGGKVYVLVNGKLVEALAIERNIPVELKDHVSTFHWLFFTLSGDEKAIQQNIERSLHLVDASAKRIYENLSEQGYYSNLIAANISQTVQIDSITLDMKNMPYYFKCFAKQTIKRQTSEVTRRLITEGYIRTGILQSEYNNHGFRIENWRIVENIDLTVQLK